MKKYARDLRYQNSRINANSSVTLKFGPVHSGGTVVSLYSGEVATLNPGITVLTPPTPEIIGSITGGTRIMAREIDNGNGGITPGTSINPNQLKIEIFNDKNELVAGGLGTALYDYKPLEPDNHFQDAATNAEITNTFSSVANWSAKISNLSANTINALILFDYHGDRRITPLRIELIKRNKAINDFLNSFGEGALDITIDQKMYYQVYNNGKISVVGDESQLPPHAADINSGRVNTAQPYYRAFKMPLISISNILESHYPEIREMVADLNKSFSELENMSLSLSHSGGSNTVTLKPQKVGLTIINGNLAVQLRIRAIEEFDLHYVYYGFFETHIKNVDKFGFDLSLEINNEETGKVIHPRVDPVFNYNKERTDAHISADGLFNIGVSNLVNILVGFFKNLADNYAEEILSFKLNTPTAQAKFFSRLFEDSLNPAATPLVTIANDVTFEGYEEIPFVDMDIARPPIGHSV